MNRLKFLLPLVLVATVSFTACNSSRQIHSASLYNTVWELDSLANYSNDEFENMYSEKKPTITFNKSTKKVQGTNSCNGYSADFTLDGNSISFGEPGPTTMMYCGEGESVFLDAMKKVNKYSIDKKGTLLLLVDESIWMRFQKSTDSTQMN